MTFYNEIWIFPRLYVGNEQYTVSDKQNNGPTHIVKFCWCLFLIYIWYTLGVAVVLLYEFAFLLQQVANNETNNATNKAKIFRMLYNSQRNMYNNS